MTMKVILVSINLHGQGGAATISGFHFLTNKLLASFLSSSSPLSTIKISRSAVLVFSIFIVALSSARACLKRAGSKTVKSARFLTRSMTRSSHPHLCPFYQPHPDHQKLAGAPKGARGWGQRVQCGVELRSGSHRFQI